MNSIAKSKAKNDSASWTSQFAAALVSAGMFKPSQGKVVRQVTFFALWLLTALLAWEIGSYAPAILEAMGVQTRDAPAIYLTFGILTLIGAWVSYRAINMPIFADFLIGTEAEMRKVTWPTRQELVRGSVVVMVVILGLAASMFVFDLIWAWIFNLIGLR